MIQYAVFTVPVFDTQKELNELNTFLRSHRVYHVEKQFISSAKAAGWSFCIEYETQVSVNGKNRIDYKDVLSEKEFVVYSKLREIRKLAAAEWNVPLYAVFTNEQLAAMVKNRTATVKQMKEINGVGESKTEHYGKYFIEFLHSVFKEMDDETNQ